MAQDDPWKSLTKGDRVQVMFRSGNTILGNLTGKPLDPRLAPGPIDYSSVSEITIDVSLEYPGLNGTMTIPKKEIKERRVSQKSVMPEGFEQILKDDEFRDLMRFVLEAPVGKQ